MGRRPAAAAWAALATRAAAARPRPRSRPRAQVSPVERARATSEEMAAAGMPLFAALARPRGARMQTLGARAKRARHQQQQRRRTARRRPPRQRAPLELRHSCRRRRSLRPQAAAVPAQGSSAPSRLQNCTASRANCCAAASDTLSSLAPHCYACRSERSSWAPACRARAARCLVAAQVSLPRQANDATACNSAFLFPPTCGVRQVWPTALDDSMLAPSASSSGRSV